MTAAIVPAQECGTACPSAADIQVRKQLEDTARAIHEEYSRCFAKVDFEAFRACWMQAAIATTLIGADPRLYVEAQRTRGMALDPEDMASLNAVGGFIRWELQRDADLVDEYRHAERVLASHPTLGCATHADFWLLTRLGVSATYVVVWAQMKHPADATKAFAVFGRCAADELRSSKRLRRYVVGLHPSLNIDTFITNLDDAVAQFEALCAAREG